MILTKDDRFIQQADLLENALAQPFPGRERGWTENVLLALEDLEQDLLGHDLVSDASDTLRTRENPSAAWTTPTLVRRVSALCQEEVELLDQVNQLRRQVQNAWQAFQGPAELSMQLEPPLLTP